MFSDALASYNDLSRDYTHQVIDHAESYVCGKVHTNGLENFWSLDHSAPPVRTPFERFTEAMKRIMGTPKAEVEQRAREAKRQRRQVKKRKLS